MKLHDILNEKLGSYVFRKESIKILSLMLRSDKLILDEYSAGDKKYYVLKTSPTRSAIVEPTEKAVAILQLNGDKLNAELKHKNVKLYLNDKNKNPGDKLYSDSRFIPNASNFIEQISVLVADKDIVPVRDFKEIEEMCKEKGIPLYFYNKPEDFINNRRQNKITLGTPDYNYKRQNYSGIPESVKALVFFSNKSSLEKIPEKYSRYIHQFISEHQRAIFTKRLKDDLKKVKDNPLARQLLTNLFNKSGSDNVEALVKALGEKWRAIINQPKKK